VLAVHIFSSLYFPKVSRCRALDKSRKIITNYNVIVDCNFAVKLEFVSDHCENRVKQCWLMGEEAMAQINKVNNIVSLNIWIPLASVTLCFPVEILNENYLVVDKVLGISYDFHFMVELSLSWNKHSTLEKKILHSPPITVV
jgi:hypothetical protein